MSQTQQCNMVFFMLDQSHTKVLLLKVLQKHNCLFRVVLFCCVEQKIEPLLKVHKTLNRLFWILNVKLEIKKKKKHIGTNFNKM